MRQQIFHNVDDPARGRRSTAAVQSFGPASACARPVARLLLAGLTALCLLAAPIAFAQEAAEATEAEGTPEDEAALPAEPPLGDIDILAPYAIVIDAETGVVLLERSPDAPFPPASLSKLMTVVMAFEALDSGRITLEDTYEVSRNAYQKEGSKMFLDLRDDPTTEDLLRGIVVQSGNDASIALAEGLAGTEEVFAERMTERGLELGLTRSVFQNAHGLPQEGHVTSARDLGLIARHIVLNFPHYLGYFSERSFEWANIEQRNRNPVLYMDIGADGMKTGFTREAGYGIVATAEQDGRRIIVVLAGYESSELRSREARRVIQWAFREFEHVPLGQAGDIVGEAEVWIGERAVVPLALARDLVAIAPIAGDGDARAVVRYTGPVPAPIEEGQLIGVLRVEVGGVGVLETPLVAARSVALGGYFARLEAGAGTLLRWSWGRVAAMIGRDGASDAPEAEPR